MIDRSYYTCIKRLYVTPPSPPPSHVHLQVKVQDEDVTFALKVIKKKHIVDNRQEEHIHSERKILTEARSPFVVKSVLQPPSVYPPSLSSAPSAQEQTVIRFLMRSQSRPPADYVVSAGRNRGGYKDVPFVNVLAVK